MVRTLIVFILILTSTLLVPVSSNIFAQGSSQNDHSIRTETTILARTALHKDSVYRLFEVIQTRGRWILPDVGYIDFGDTGDYREFWGGGGAILHRSDHMLLIFEGLVTVAAGSATDRAIYFQPWVLFGYTITPRLTGEVVYFPYIPLNKAGVAQHLIERAKLDYDLGIFKVGGGYSGLQFGTDRWKHRPFLSTTVGLGRLGALELWVQKVSGEGRHLRTQIRYSLNLTH
ncbi:MAG: hypothetical protein VYA53_08490 [Acidobacteriota bacterium]|nr:hypothetical protein [Acidobacteriota bacterium]